MNLGNLRFGYPYFRRSVPFETTRVLCVLLFGEIIFERNEYTTDPITTLERQNPSQVIFRATKNSFDFQALEL